MSEKADFQKENILSNPNRVSKKCGGIYSLQNYSHLVLEVVPGVAEDLPHGHQGQVVLLLIALYLATIVTHRVNLAQNEPKFLADFLDLVR